MKLKPYPEYKDSGVEWIGEIPLSWGIFKLKHVINEFISGGTPNSDNEKFWVQDKEDGIPWVAIGDMTNNEVVVDTKKKITLDGLANKKLRILKSGTLIYSIFASLGKVSLLGIDATTNQAILGLITNEKIDGTFLKYYLRYLEQPIIALSNANTQNNLNSTIVRNIEFSLPKDYNNQKNIASFLNKKTSEIDLTIEKDTRLIELLKEKRTALINYVVTKGLDPTVKMKNSGAEWIGEIPGHWKVKKAKQMFIEINNRSRGNNEELLSVSHITGVTPRSEKPDITMFKAETTEGYKICEVGDLVINTMWAWMGAMGISNYKGVVSPSYNVYRFKVSDLDVNYYDALFRTPSFTAEATRWSKGIWSSRLRLYPDGFFQIQLPLPPENEQLEIGNLIIRETERINKLISTITKGITLLEEYKKSLIHNVVTGKVDVREEAV